MISPTPEAVWMIVVTNRIATSTFCSAFRSTATSKALSIHVYK